MIRDERSHAAFPEPRWSLVRRAQGSCKDSQRALEEICQSYWRPLYAFARHSGRSPEEAEDSTQEFLIHLLTKEAFHGLDGNRGKLRSFLLAAFQNFKIDQVKPASLDTGAVESDIRQLDHRATPDEVFERQWALGLLDQALLMLEKEYREADKAQVFELLHPVLQGGPDTGYRSLGEKLGMREGAVKVAVHRLRQRFRNCLESCVLETVGEQSEVRDELEFLKKVLSRAK